MRRWMPFILLGVSSLAMAADQGLHDDRIVIGQISDLSGATVVWGVPTTNATRMRIDEVNEAGGIHGRRIELVVEDGQYQVPVSVKAANKLMNRDRVFAMLGNIGTPANHAIMPRQLRMGIPNLFPVTAAVGMYEPFHPMKFAYYVSYRDQIRGGVRYMVEKTGASGFVTLLPWLEEQLTFEHWTQDSYPVVANGAPGSLGRSSTVGSRS